VAGELGVVAIEEVAIEWLMRRYSKGAVPGNGFA
jgi:hypothetical protein